MDIPIFRRFNSALPGGIFSYQKSQYEYILEYLEIDDVGICVLCPLGIF
jgi:hypothetical protein